MGLFTVHYPWICHLFLIVFTFKKIITRICSFANKSHHKKATLPLLKCCTAMQSVNVNPWFFMVHIQNVCILANSLFTDRSADFKYRAVECESVKSARCVGEIWVHEDATWSGVDWSTNDLGQHSSYGGVWSAMSSHSEQCTEGGLVPWILCHYSPGNCQDVINNQSRNFLTIWQLKII